MSCNGSNLEVIRIISLLPHPRNPCTELCSYFSADVDAVTPSRNTQSPFRNHCELKYLDLQFKDKMGTICYPTHQLLLHPFQGGAFVLGANGKPEDEEVKIKETEMIGGKAKKIENQDNELVKLVI